jgi:hypothetical protein
VGYARLGKNNQKNPSVAKVIPQGLLYDFDDVVIRLITEIRLAWGILLNESNILNIFSEFPWGIVKLFLLDSVNR